MKNTEGKGTSKSEKDRKEGKGYYEVNVCRLIIVVYRVEKIDYNR
jgi:hypothetical protein